MKDYRLSLIFFKTPTKGDFIFHFDSYQHTVVVVAVQVHAERRVVGVRLQDRLDGRHSRRHKQRVHRFTCRKKTTTLKISCWIKRSASSGCKAAHRRLTLLVQQHHDAVAVGVAIEMPGDDVAVLPADGHQPLVVALPDGGGVTDEGQVTHWDVSYDVDLRWGGSYVSFSA